MSSEANISNDLAVTKQIFLKMKVIPGSISYQTGKLMGAETLSSVSNN